MSSRETAELVERALEIARSGDLGGAPAATLRPSDTLDPLLRAVYSAQRPWELREGQRLSWVRRPLLRVLAPYVMRQEELNEILSATVVALADEVQRLSVELETRAVAPSPESGRA